ncbi:MAG TPA: type II toxin-antitoxin system VapC family toxin [Pseudonocardiaceae bacterium]|nr:type II toxin-antitoxin system VapC family toxin [Pseudonocardiaceae bacterium]
MIVLDTNVVSELRRRRPDQNVLAWLDACPADLMFLTATTAAELWFGIARIPDGSRKTALAAQTRGVLDEDFADRVLPFTAAAAVVYADITAARERRGQPIGMADAQIAAICRVHGMDLATRNVKDFADTGVRVVNPRDAAGPTSGRS